MKNQLIKKTLVLGIIILFVGLAIAPTIIGKSTLLNKIIRINTHERTFYQNIPPIANFTYEPTEITTGELIYFNSTSYDPDGTITNWTWDFGDGNTAYDEYTTHTYTDNGIYTANLTVMDNGSATASIEKTVNVGNQPPIADFTFTPESPSTTETVYFNDTTYDPDGIIITWWWQFGDGYYSSLQNPIHKCIIEGDYIINLTVTDDDGSVDSVEKPITVLPPNDPPYEPSDPYPMDGVIDIDLNITLSWKCSDPDNDPLTYDVYFGNVTPPPKVVDKQINKSWNPGTLDMETVYYWQIVAWDVRNASTSGPIWNFTTVGPPNDPPYGPIITGPDIVQKGKEYTFMFQTIDPDGDDVRFIVTWGDSTEDVSEFVPQNMPVIINHTWDIIAPVMILRITATAEDHHGAKSVLIERWVIVVGFNSLYRIQSAPTLKINQQSHQNSQTRTRNLFIFRLFESFPNLFKILEILLK